MNDEPERITFYTDENTRNALISQLREREIQVVRFVDVHPHGTDDETHLQYATSRRWIVVTRDDDFLSLQAERWEAGLQAAGVVFINPPSWRKIGLQLRKLVEIHQNETPDSMMNQRRWI